MNLEGVVSLGSWCLERESAFLSEAGSFSALGGSSLGGDLREGWMTSG